VTRLEELDGTAPRWNAPAGPPGSGLSGAIGGAPGNRPSGTIGVMTEEQAQQGHDKAQVSVLPGIPGQMERLETGEGAYPSTTTDFVKLLREAGLTVEFVEEPDERREVSYQFADILIPTLLFIHDVGWAVAVDYLTGAIRELFGGDRLKKSDLHVKFGKRSADGEARWFEADGKAEDVFKAMREAHMDD
jgi:hypothetical protein